MKGKALIYRPGQYEPETIDLTEAVTLEFLQKAVDGWIEKVPSFETIEIAGANTPCVVFCNEEGKLKRLPCNNAATIAWDRAIRQMLDAAGKRLYPTGLWNYAESWAPADVLVGPVIVITGDDELMETV